MIRVEDLKKSFGSKEVLKGISFEIKKGDIVFVLGTSGTGKSVLLKLTVGLLQSSSGRIWVGDDEITNFSEEEFLKIRKKCGMVFQHPALFDSLSIFDNIAFGLRRHHNLSEEELQEKVKKALDLVNLRGIEEKKPQEISYGMQKRVSLARTVAVGPEILLFDEPTTGLDPITTTAINQLIKDLSVKLKTTSIVVSHDMHCALDIADRIIVLDKGEVIADGAPQDIKNSKHPLVSDFMLETQVGQ